MLLLSRNAGTGSRYIEDVYFHHESESKKTWDTLMQNRVFYNKQKKSINQNCWLRLKICWMV